jgi:hypothetical protein
MPDITDPLASLQTPFMKGLNNFKPALTNPKPDSSELGGYRPVFQGDLGKLHKAFQDSENNDGMTPDAITSSKVDEHPQDFRDLAMNINGLAILTQKPSSDIGLNYEQEKQKFVKDQGWDMPKSEGEFRGQLAGYVENKYNKKQALDELYSDTVLKALADTDYGNHRGVAELPTDLASVWNQKHAPLIPDQKERDAYHEQARSLYLQTMKQVAPIRKEVAASLKVLSDYTEGKADQASVDQLATMFAEMPPEQVDKILGLAAIATKREHLDKKVTKGFFQNLGENIQRSADITGDFLSNGELTNLDLLDKQIKAGNTIYVSKAGDVKTGDVMPVTPNAMLEGQQVPEQAGMPATPEQVASLKEQVGKKMRAAKLSIRLKAFAQSDIDPITPLSKEGTLLRSLEMGVYDTGSSLVPMVATAISPFAGFEAYRTMNLNALVLKNPDADLQSLNLLAGVEGALEAVGDMLQIRLVKGLMPKIVDNYIKKLGTKAGRAALRVVESIAGEYAIETAQDAIAPVTEGAVNAMGADINQTATWDDFQVFDSRRFFAIAFMGGVGAGVATFNDLKNPRRQANRRDLAYNGIHGAQAEYVLASESSEEATTRLQEVYSERTEADIAKGEELQVQDSIRAKEKKGTNDTYTAVRNAAGEIEWVVSDYTGKEVGRVADEEAAKNLISDRVQAEIESQQNATFDLLDWWKQQDPNNTATIEAPKTVQQELDRMQGVGDTAGIANLHERIAFAIESGEINPDADFNTLNILGGAKLETTAEGVFRGVISLAENAKPEDAFEEINHVFVKRALAEGRVTMPQLQSWLAQTEAATGTKYARETETDVMENIAKIGMDYAAGRIDESVMPQSFVDYVKKLLLVLKESMLRALKLKDAFAEGKIDQNFESFLAESVGLDPQILFDRESDRVAGEIAGDSYSLSETDPYKDREGEQAGEPLTKTEIQEGIEDESGTTADVQIDPDAWEKLDYSIRKGAPKESAIPIIEYKTLKGKSVFVYFSDRMRVGEYTGLDPKSGIKIFLQGGPSYPFTLGNIDSDAAWAFSDEGMWTRFNNRVNGTDGIGVICLYSRGNVRANGTFLNAYFQEVQWAIKSEKLSEKDFLVEANKLREAALKKKKRDGTTVGESKGAWIPAWKSKWTSLEQTQSALADTTFETRAGSFFGYDANKKGANKGSMIGKDGLVAKGFPNISDMIDMMEDTRFEGKEYGDMVGAVQFEQGQTQPQSAQSLNVREHGSYPVIIKGKGLGLFTHSEHVTKVLKTDKKGFQATRSAETSMAGVSFSIRSKEEADQILGPSHPELSGKPKEAIERLIADKTGYVPAALNHPEIGPVDIIWGEKLPKKSQSYGLAKIVEWHQEAIPAIENNFAEATITSRNENTVQLEFNGIRFAVRKGWFGNEQHWLLTAYEDRKGESAGETIDTSGPDGEKVTQLSSQGSQENNPSSDTEVNPAFSIRSQENIDSVTASMQTSQLFTEPKLSMYERAKQRFTSVLEKNRDTLLGMEASGASSQAIRNEKLKQALIELDGILKTLPYEVRGRVGGMSVLANIGTGDKALADFFKKRVEMLDKELERYLGKEYDEATYKFLQTTLPKKREAGEKPKGIGADLMSMFAVVREAQRWNDDEVNAHLAKIDHLINSGTLSAEEEAKLTREGDLVSAIGNWKDKTSDAKRQALFMMKSTWSKGYQKFLTDKVIEKQERDAARSKAIANTGKNGLLSQRQEEDKKQQGVGGNFKKGYFNLIGWDHFVSILFGENSETAKFLANGEREASNTKEDRTQAKLDEVADFFTKLAGSRLAGEELRYNMAQKTIKPFTGTPWSGLEFSQMEALSATMLWMQEDGRRHMEGKLDENGQPISAWHYNQKFVDMLEDSLSPEAKALRAFLLDKYEKGYHDINKVYSELNGVSLPQIANYSPVTVAPVTAPAGSAIDPVTGSVTAARGSSPSALRTRGTSYSEPKFQDVLQTYLAHTRQMEHWMAYAPFMKEANGILRNRDVQNAIHAKGGEEAKRVLNLHLDIMNQGGVRDAATQLGLNAALSKIGGRAAQIALVGRLSTIVLQSTQLGASLAEMPTGAYILRLSKLLSGNLGWGEALKSDYIQRRLKEMPPIVRQAMEGLHADKPNKLKHAVESLGRLISGADALFTAGTYAMVYDYHLTQAKSMGIPSPEEYAHGVAERATDKLAQPTRMGARSVFENTQTGPLARAGWAFASEARKNIGLAAYALAERPAAVKARTLFSLLVLNSLVGTIIRNAWRDAKDSDDKEVFDEKHWSIKRLMLNALTDPLQGIPLLGDAVKGAAFKASGEYLPQGNLFSIDGAAGIFSQKHLKNDTDLINGRGDWEMAFKDVDHLVSGIGMLNGTMSAAASLTHLASDLFGAGKNAVKSTE